MVRLIIIRHGYSMGNKEKRFTGQGDLPLDETGISQAASTAEYVLENYWVDSVYSSDLSRAVDTVKPIADALGLPVHTCKDLREMDVGDWYGKQIGEVAELFPESCAVYKNTPGLVRFDGGESVAEVKERVLRAMDKIIAENEGKTVVIGTHGGTIRTLQTAWKDLPLERMQEIPHVSNASVTVVFYKNGKAEFIETGYNAHLTEITAQDGV